MKVLKQFRNFETNEKKKNYHKLTYNKELNKNKNE